MDEVVQPRTEVLEAVKKKRVIVASHDEMSAHTKDFVRRSYSRDGATGQMQSKDRGELEMVAGFISAEDGKHNNLFKLSNNKYK